MSEPLRIMIGMPTTRPLEPKVVQSLLRTFLKCWELGVSVQMGFIVDSSIITFARDGVADQFLKTPDSLLFWIDSDIVWEPEQFLRLVMLAEHRDIVCAAYPSKTDEDMTFYIRFDRSEPVKRDLAGLVKIEGVGIGFTVMKRSVVERLVAQAPRVKHATAGGADEETAGLFRVDVAEGRRRGEDMAFFADCRAAGYDIWLDTTIDLGHIGTKEYRAPPGAVVSYFKEMEEKNRGTK